MKANSVVKRKPELYSNDLIICPSKCCFATKDLADYEKHLNHTGHKALAENKFLVREGFKKVMGLGHCLNTEGRREEAGEGGGGGWGQTPQIVYSNLFQCFDSKIELKSALIQQN